MNTDIVDVIGGYVRLEHHRHVSVGHCPFHRERTPSFTVSHFTHRYKCFGCGAQGDVHDFIAAIERHQ